MHLKRPEILYDFLLSPCHEPLYNQWLLGGSRGGAGGGSGGGEDVSPPLLSHIHTVHTLTHTSPPLLWQQARVLVRLL